MNIWDIFRIVSAVLYVLLVMQTVATVSYYFYARKNEKTAGQTPPGILPLHVIEIGIALLVLSGEAVYQNLSRLGEEATVYAILNPLVFILANKAIYLITHYEYTRYRISKSHLPL